MKITVVSRSWPSNEKSGVALAAAEHVRLLAEAGHAVTIIGAHQAVVDETLPVIARFHVPAKGSGALYAPARINRGMLRDVLNRAEPDLILVEAWQTALTDAAVDAAHELGLPVIMISHGISLHPFTQRAPDVLRAWAWTWYRLFTLPRLVRRLSGLAVLDMESKSPRFYDRDLALRLKTSVVPITNSPVNWRLGSKTPEERRRQIILVGYFSSVKNQLGALPVLAGLPKDLTLCFVGGRSGAYYDKCVSAAKAMDLSSRVRFLEDHECDLAQEIAESLVLLSTSVTEVLPLTLLEAMASGTPFVATPVGAVPSLDAGLLADRCEAQRDAIIRLASDPQLWTRKAQEGRTEFERRYTREAVRDSLLKIVEFAIEASHESRRVPGKTLRAEQGP